MERQQCLRTRMLMETMGSKELGLWRADISERPRKSPAFVRMRFKASEFLMLSFPDTNARFHILAAQWRILI
ncbi:hypothetical protein CEXT_474031 [Caerostris extrusa]|uniref:Uncharacterized protein n=1 Tax=Caerostris extrusa TaxID=172846 RepID=A0AAV4WEM0_CAEEX|nr:hypothetical protein CEXT_474031 [Caerostris extrusa]